MKWRLFCLLAGLQMVSACLPHYYTEVLKNQSGKTVSLRSFADPGSRDAGLTVPDGATIDLPDAPIALHVGSDAYYYPNLMLVPCEGRPVGIRTSVGEYTILSDMTIMPNGSDRNGNRIHVRPNVWRPRCLVRMRPEDLSIGLSEQDGLNVSNALAQVGSPCRFVIECHPGVPLHRMLQKQEELRQIGAESILVSLAGQTNSPILHLSRGRNPSHEGMNSGFVFLDRMPEYWRVVPSLGLMHVATPPAAVGEAQFFYDRNLTVGETYERILSIPGAEQAFFRTDELDNPLRPESPPILPIWLVDYASGEPHDRLLNSEYGDF